MIFRPFNDDDAVRLQDFRCATKRDPKHERFINRMLRTQLLDVLADPSRDLRAFVAEGDDGKLLGIATMEISRTHRQWELTVLGVDVSAKHRGIGRALIGFSVEHTPESHDSTVLFQVHVANTPMRRMLSSLQAELVEGANDDDYLVLATDPTVLTQDLQANMVKTQRAAHARTDATSLDSIS